MNYICLWARHPAVCQCQGLNQKEPGAGTGTARHTEASFSWKSRASWVPWEHLIPSRTNGCTPKPPRDTLSCANVVTWPRIVSVVTARACRSSSPAAAAGLTLPHVCLGLSVGSKTPQTIGDPNNQTSPSSSSQRPSAVLFLRFILSTGLDCLLGQDPTSSSPWPVPILGRQVGSPSTQRQDTVQLTVQDLSRPTAQDSVYREDCTECFDSIVCIFPHLVWSCSFAPRAS